VTSPALVSHFVVNDATSGESLFEEGRTETSLVFIGVILELLFLLFIEGECVDEATDDGDSSPVSVKISDIVHAAVDSESKNKVMCEMKLLGLWPL
jgi:hypothetical protein